MEKVFRIALVLWMLLLTARLRANPVDLKKREPLNLMDLGLQLLQGVSCIDNATFAFPKHVDEKCYTTALKLFIKGLDEAKETCDTVHHIEQTQEVLTLHDVQQKDTDCNFTPTVHDKFQNFVEAMEKFAQQFNDSL